MIVLGIESSCDETAAALVNEHGDVLSDVVASQIDVHAEFGGIVPELASRAHIRNIVPVIRNAVSVLPGGFSDVDAFAVTQGPGLVGALLVGLQTAKSLAWSVGRPLVGVNHLDGHLLAVHLRKEGESRRAPEYPYIALLASGGHTAIYRVQSWSDIRLLGQTRDDAAGEAFDKAAKMLSLGYPGGPVVDRLAGEGCLEQKLFSVPMPSLENLDFSFSGLKSALARHIELRGIPGGRGLADLCASFQFAVVEALVRKSVAACKTQGVPRLVLTGGVAANRGLRERAKQSCLAEGIELYVPPAASCTDNAAMIAYAGALRLAAGEQDEAPTVYSRDPHRRRGKFRRDGTLAPRT